LDCWGLGAETSAVDQQVDDGTQGNSHAELEDSRFYTVFSVRNLSLWFLASNP